MPCPFSSRLASTICNHDHHPHTDGVCPIMGDTHAFCPPQPGDHRSPCPALNTLANHGYLPRDGKKISVFNIIEALEEGYRLSTLLACSLALRGVRLLSKYRSISLSDLARHNLIEHDASLFHLDAYDEDEYAPTSSDESLVRVAIERGGRYHPNHMALEDVANIRAKREAEYQPLDRIHAGTAWEMVIAIGALGGPKADTKGLDMDLLRLWVEEERLPDDWRPNHTQGLFKTRRMTTVIQKRVKAMKEGKMHNILDDKRSPKEWAKTE